MTSLALIFESRSEPSFFFENALRNFLMRSQIIFVFNDLKNKRRDDSLYLQAEILGEMACV